jgi:DNA-binding MarR family transcriptional regulator
MESTYASLRLFDATVRYEVVLWGRLELAVARACDIKLGSLTALRTIAGRDGTGRVQDAAADLGITVGAVSKIVDRLEHRGYVRRLPNSADRRSSLIEITEAGAEVLARGVQVMVDELHAHLRPLVNESQLEEATRLLEDLADACIVGERAAA